MSRFCPLFSSSKGNSAYLSGGGTTLLVDAGVSLRQLNLAIRDHDLTLDDFSGVLITHEHSDHIRGLPVLLKKYPLPVYASRGTLQHLFAKGYIPAGVQVSEIDKTTSIGDIAVTPFDTPHDADHSIGFHFVMPDQRTLSIATDLGYITDRVRDHITGSDLVMLESNYDLGMLECSAYPYSLKRRIKSDYGHLSNEICAQECARLIHSGTTRLVLGHLSENNNVPGLARQTAKMVLDAAQMQEDKDYILRVAPPRGYSECITF